MVSVTLHGIWSQPSDGIIQKETDSVKLVLEERDETDQIQLTSIVKEPYSVNTHVLDKDTLTDDLIQTITRRESHGEEIDNIISDLNSNSSTGYC
jgi:hypothetical protein